MSMAQQGANPQPPSAQEVLVTLIREAPNLTAKNALKGEDPSDTAVLFIAEILHELGIVAEDTKDTYTFSVECQPVAPRDGHWNCYVTLGIKWSDAESAIIGEFELQPDAERSAWEPVRFDTSDDFPPCGWRVYEQSINVYIVG
jgi:hypothetical protein